ncbi:MAG: hypothetical protein H0W50_01465 [Parachlamydiaceae bacterium]|nr:hypothetical protein [Parachlamydiaceae bacterium]
MEVSRNSTTPDEFVQLINDISQTAIMDEYTFQQRIMIILQKIDFSGYDRCTLSFCFEELKKV